MTSMRVSAVPARGGSMRWYSRPPWIWAAAFSASRARAGASSHCFMLPRRFIGQALSLRLGLGKLLARLADQGVRGGEHCFLRRARQDDIPALDGQSRHSVELVRARHLRGAAQLALYRERMEGGVVLGHIDFLLAEPFGDPFGK